jgi:hypothetical protein
MPALRGSKAIGTLFSIPMAKALWDGRKRMTRRLKTSARVGDRLWVREPWRTRERYEDMKPSELSMDTPIFYEAEATREDTDLGRLRPGMFMPSWASRMTLVVTDRRQEPLQKITDADLLDEGMVKVAHPTAAYSAYGRLWDKLNGMGSWDSNPSVNVISFNVYRTNINLLRAGFGGVTWPESVDSGDK